MKKRHRNKFGPAVPFWSPHHQRWLVRFKERGVRKERRFRAKQDAIAFSTEKWKDQQDGINSLDMTMRELIRRFLASKSNLSKSTLSDYTRTLSQALPLYSAQISSIRPFVIDELIDSLESSASRHRLRCKLSMLFRQAVRWELLRRNPVDAAKSVSHRPEKAETFSISEVEKILETANQHRLVGMFDLGFTLGPRPEELFGFQWQDWKEDAEILHLRRKVAEVGGKLDIGPPKTAASTRDLTLPRHITDRLMDRRKAALKEGCAGRDDWIWPNRRGNPMRRSNLRNHVWVNLLESAEVPYRKMYCMRHTAASTMLNGISDVRGVALAVVSATLGHDNPQITLERYSHVLTTDKNQVQEFWDRAKLALKGNR